MDKIKTVKIKNEDGTVSEESYSISVDATNVDMSNGRDLQDTVGNINIDEDGSIAEQLKNIKKKIYYYNTVADMKVDTGLKTGDMAITLGYYQVNDGGGAEYKIVSITGEYAEILDNNLKAELIIKNEVNVKQFGAYGDGIHDDTEKLINAHTYANNKLINVIYPHGTYYIKTASKTHCPIINTNCDFSNASLLFDPYMDNKYAYIIADPATLDNTQQLQSVSLTSTQIADLTKSNSDAINWLANYKNCYIHLTTDMSLGQRNYSSTKPTDILYHRQSLKVNDYGQLEPNILYADIAGNATTVIMRYASAFQPTITLNMGKIIISGNCNNHPCFYITRNNVVIQNGTIEKINYTNATHVWYSALFAFNNCGHITFRNFNGNTACAETYAIDQTDYICSFTACYDVHVENNVILKGHGAFCSHFCSFINFEGNYCNRFDNHYGCYGIININNNTITGYPGCVNLGYGDATVNVINNHIESYTDNGKKNCNIIRCRQDFGLMFSGKLNIKDNFYENHTTTIPHFFEFKGSVGVSGTIYPDWGDYRLPELDMVNNKLTSTGDNIECYVVDIENKSSKIRTYGTCMNFDSNEYSQYQRIYIDFNNIAAYDTGALYKIPIKIKNYQLTLIDTSNEKPAWNKPLHIYTYERSVISPFQGNHFNKSNYFIYNFGQIDIRRSCGVIYNYGTISFVENTDVISIFSSGLIQIKDGFTVTVFNVLNIQGGVLQFNSSSGIMIDSSSMAVQNFNGIIFDCSGTINLNTCQATITGCRIKNCTITGTGTLNLAGNQMNSTMATNLSSGTWSYFYAFGNLANEKTYLVNNQNIAQSSM